MYNDACIYIYTYVYIHIIYVCLYIHACIHVFMVYIHMHTDNSRIHLQISTDRQTRQTRQTGRHTLHMHSRSHTYTWYTLTHMPKFSTEIRYTPRVQAAYRLRRLAGGTPQAPVVKHPCILTIMYIRAYNMHCSAGILARAHRHTKSERENAHTLSHTHTHIARG
jgi:hypothetical protein